MKFILDTCVISEFIKKQPNDMVMTWISTQDFDDLTISVITFGEIWKGISRLPESLRKDKLTEWFEKDIVSFYHNRALPVDYSVMMIWGELNCKLEKDRKKIPIVDSFIASTAICHDYILVTRNSKDFIHTGYKLFNPWDEN